MLLRQVAKSSSRMGELVLMKVGRGSVFKVSLYGLESGILRLRTKKGKDDLFL